MNAGLGVIELALDRGPGIIIDSMRDQVDAGVNSSAVVAPVSPTANLIKLSFQRGIGLEIVHHQLLEGNAVLCFRLIFAQLIQYFREL